MIPAKTLVVTLVGAGCIAAAGIGAYVAVRSGSAAPAAAAVDAGRSAPGQSTEVAELAVPPVATGDKTPAAPKPLASRHAPQPEPAPARPAAPRAAVAEYPVGPAESVPDTSRAERDEPAVPAQPTVVTADSAEAPIEPSHPDLEAVTINRDAVIGIRLDGPISSQTARVEDRVTARVTRDVTVDGRTAIPAGARLEGNVTVVQRPGRFTERARLGLRFTSVVLPDNVRVPIQTETIFREGDAPGGEATSKIGASAVIGAILGGVIGGKKGAAIGGTAGAAGGTAAVMASDRNEATIPDGAPLTVRLTAPALVGVAPALTPRSPDN
jgi:hypothetical protein